MQVKILSEHGYEEALFGLGLSHGVTSGCNFMRDEYERFVAWHKEEDEDNVWIESGLRKERMEGVANKLAGKGNGHDKFLRQIIVWLDCQCPRFFWPELDQYKVATVTQSESTMHTITKHEFTQDMFEDGDVPHVILFYLNELREEYLKTKDKAVWKKIIKFKPESFLQRRILTCNYATLRNIIAQRTGHRLSEWEVFIDAVKSQVKHPEFLQ